MDEINSHVKTSGMPPVYKRFSKPLKSSFLPFSTAILQALKISERHMPRSFGHNAGMNRMVGLAEHARELGIKYLTVYALSTEKSSESALSFLSFLSESIASRRILRTAIFASSPVFLTCLQSKKISII